MRGQKRREAETFEFAPAGSCRNSLPNDGDDAGFVDVITLMT
jgi:hypothetical protein